MKKKIALITGGYSGEAVISYKTADTIKANLDPEKYDVYYVDLTHEGWIYRDGNGGSVPVDRNDFTLTLNGNKIHFDAAFIAMHGTPGEDGKLQGYLDMLHIPYTSCDAATSAITFNKRYTVAVAKMGGIAVAESVHLFRNSPHSVADIQDRLRFPVFVKPNNGGSSIGMSKVDDPANLAAAIEKAFKEDNQVLIESMIQGREFTVGVYRAEGTTHVLPITEVKANADKAFFDFEAKYEGKSTETTPAEIDETIAEKIRDAARNIYDMFNCRGVIRIDFIYSEKDQRPYMLEINTIPGQSAASIVPQQVRAMGGNLREFYTKLLEEALTSGGR